MKKKTISFIMGMILSVTTVFGSVGFSSVTVSAAETGITDSQCTDNGTAEPVPDETVPNDNQYKYQKDELAAFCHFGPNTFNELEWGFDTTTQSKLYEGRTPAQIFPLTDAQKFDAETLVRTLYNAGFKKLIVTAKHHDGFCIWKSKWTDYDIDSTNYTGDILEEISAACTKYNMDMGLYLSPWDVAESTFGADGGTKDNAYNDYYNHQLEEILSNDKYGNHGHFVEVWMDGANGYTRRPQTYDFDRWYSTIQTYEGKVAVNPVTGKKYTSDCMLFGAGTKTTVRWIGNEDGFADDTTWAKSIVRDGQIYNDPSQNKGDYKGDARDGFSNGYEDGNQWTVPEADARITSGWFWGNAKKSPRTLAQLSEMYFRSVGHNATLLLNVPPNNQGTIDDAILERVKEFGDNIQKTFQTNLAAASGTTVEASNVRGNDVDFKPGNTVDGDDATYWTTEDGTKEGSITVKWKSAKKFDVVSIEEAIQNGQRINSYKVEYKANDNADWQTMGSGVTVGAKRLIRTSPVSATQVRITVGTSEGKVPMLSEIGIYKASEGFQLSGTAPEGMDTTSVNNTSKFNFDSSGWHAQTGTQYINGQNTYSDKANASFTYTFNGTKVYLMGTKDPGHGTADIYIDNKFVETIDTSATSRTTGTRIFESADLEDGSHTLKLVTKSTKAVGVEAAYVINNGGKGMLEIENTSYTVNEGSRLAVKIRRVGGTNGTITAKLEPNPGSAIQKHFDTELIPEVTLVDGEKEKVIDPAAVTNHIAEEEAEVYFTLVLTSDDPVVGMDSSAKVTIRDIDGITKTDLETLVSTVNKEHEEVYLSGWNNVSAALQAAQSVLDNEASEKEAVVNAYLALEAATTEAIVRTKYTADDRFQFPQELGTSKILEAEFATTITEACGNEKYKCEIGKESWASNGKYINSMNQTDKGTDSVEYAYNAPKAGTYHVVATYRSGDTKDKNKIAWSEKNGKIEAGNVVTKGTNKDGTLQVGTVEFDLVVTVPGTGTLVLTPVDVNGAPQLDKLLITPTKFTEIEHFDITADAGQGGSIAAEGIENGKVSVVKGDSLTVSIVPDDGYEIKDVIVDGASEGAVAEYTFDNVSKNHTIQAVFAMTHYTENNRFVFPTEKGENGKKVLEAEYAQLENVVNSKDESGKWPLQVASESWASNGKYVNCFNDEDTIKIPYHADYAGTYKFTVTYRSGAESNDNTYIWSEQDAKITYGKIAVNHTKVNGKLTAGTAEFNVTVTTPGDGVLIFTAPPTDSPQTDKFDVELVEKTNTVDLEELRNAVEQAEALVNSEEKVQYSEEALAELETFIKTGSSMTSANTQEEVDQAKKDILDKIAEIQTKYTIAATAGEGGTITPAGEKEVYNRTSQMYTVEADEGYEVDSVKVDDKAVELTDNTYTFNSVTGNHTICVTFRKSVILESLKVTPPTKTTYLQGDEALKTEGMEVKAVYSDGTEKVLTEDEYQISGFDSATVGTKEITVAYEGVTATFTIQVDICYIVTVNGQVYARGQYNDLVTITAEEQEGHIFAGWKDASGKVVSTKATYSFRLAGDRTFTSVYDQTLEVEAQAKLNNAFVSSKKADGSGSTRFVGQIIVPKGYRVQECGLIRTADDETTMPKLYESDGKSLTAIAKKTVAKSYTCNYQFSITINKVPSGKTVRGVIYAKLTNGNDTMYVFSEENSVTVK